MGATPAHSRETLADTLARLRTRADELARRAGRELEPETETRSQTLDCDHRRPEDAQA